VSEPEEDFAAMFEASLKARRFEKGQTIEGRIVAIGPEVAFIDVGGKGEAMIDIGELKDADGNLEVSAGDRIQAMVISTVGGLQLSRKLALGAATARQLEDAFRSGLAVEGKVERAVKGGYEVRIARQRGFCPMSQIDIVRNTDPAEHQGRVYAFRIIEYKEGGRNIVVSRRALLEEEQRAQAEELRRSIAVGDVVTGTVASVRDFGAFVDLGAGVQGLLHVSEMGWSRKSDASQLVTPGEPITVKVLQIDDQKQKISLGLKQLSADPWTTVEATYAVGQVHTGRVTRITDFGAFVELEPGIEGLAHVSTFEPTGRPNGWAKSIAAGATAAFEILTIDLEKKRIGVALVPADAAAYRARTAADTEIAAGARLKGKVDRHEKFGVFVFLAPGRIGLVPQSETGLAIGADATKAFPVGSDIDVIVLEVEPGGRRIRLSVKAIAAAQESEQVREYAAQSDAGQADGFGLLADKLRGALQSKKK
jgi:small subunit ribosomal protein S1